ncbi:hypothetical protein GCM10010517_37150 [Streptosporangium fragile]|uniref:CobQ/CobB/MinD/ParA nucleotide binding domain-containing protein n=1 Tax=Streptosporangium fragile TaxID=46186 RepID=A0ABN3VZ53_9ACTN
MARHDREESLEEQLAWLDAIKEQEEEPALVVPAATVEDTVISPYPRDPWSLVPSEPDATSSPLFRAAVDSAHLPGGPGAPATDLPVEEADAAEWLEASDTAGSFTVPAPTSATDDNDGFLAPLKPLPREEPGDAGDYGPGDFTEPRIRTSFTEPDETPSRGLFEQPRRSAEPSGPVQDSGSTQDSGSARDSGFEPARPAAQGSERFAFGGAGTERDTFGGDTERFAFGGDTERFAFGGGDQDRTRPAGGKDLPADPPAAAGSPASSSAASSPAGTEPDRFAPGGTGFGGTDRGFRGTEPAFGATDPGLSGTDPGRDRSAFDPTFEPASPFTAQESFRREPSSQEPARQEPSRQEDGRLEPAVPAASPAPAPTPEPEHETFRREAPEPFRTPPAEAFEPFRTASDSFGAARPEPSTAERTAPASGSAFLGSPESSAAPSGFPAFTRDHDTAFAPGRDTSAPDLNASATGRDASAPAERDPVSSPERENAFAPTRDAAEPAREPYQARRRQTPPPPAFTTPSRQQNPDAPRPSADSLDPDSLLRGRRNAPAGGWRKLVYKASAGLIKPGESPEVRRRRELIARARTPVATGHHRVAVLSLKGGVGKTTTTVGLGATLAQVRGDRVIAVDANPDRGTLSDKVELETSATVRDLLNERQQIKRYVDIRAFTSQAPSRLEILASDRDPSVSEAFGASDYQAVSQVLENFYSICITDCGTGLLHSAMSGVLGLADQLVLVSSPSVDGARAASATLDWLEAHHYEDLVRAATVVLCSVRPRSKSTVDLDRLEAHFAARCRAVVRVPYDPHLEEGAEIDLERLQPATRDSYLRLAASVGDGFAGPQP